MNSVCVLVNIVKVNPNATIPTYASEGAAGFDIKPVVGVHLPPHSTVVIKTGLAMEVPEGFEVQIRPKSGISVNQPHLEIVLGTIDSDYRGEIGIIVRNRSNSEQWLYNDQSIAQGVVTPSYRATFLTTGSLSETKRGSGGFGSTQK